MFSRCGDAVSFEVVHCGLSSEIIQLFAVTPERAMSSVIECRWRQGVRCIVNAKARTVDSDELLRAPRLLERL
jgi:hypothetical protein